MTLSQYLFGPSKEAKARAERIEARIKRDGLRASPSDDRDIVFVPRVEPTARRVMNPHFGKVEDQGKVGRCTAETMTSICEAVKNSTGDSAEYSPDYSYHFARQFDGLTGDSGATPRGMCRSAKHYGMIPERLWPRSNDAAQWNRAPTEAEIALGKTQLLGQYEVIEPDVNSYKNTVYAVKSAMAEGLLVAMAFYVRKWMFYVDGPLGSEGHKRPFPMPAGWDEVVGGHMVPLVGYDLDIFPNSGGSFIVRNSWGTDFGDGGLWSVPFTMFSGGGFEMEMRAIRGFAGITLAPVVEPPLTMAELKQRREVLVNLGLGAINTAGDFTFSPMAEVPYFAAWTALRQFGDSPERIGQTVGLPAETIRAFEQSHKPTLDAWRASL